MDNIYYAYNDESSLTLVAAGFIEQNVKSLDKVYKKDEVKMSNIEERLAAIETKLGIKSVINSNIYSSLEADDEVLYTRFDNDLGHNLAVIKRGGESYPALLNPASKDPVNDAMDLEPDKLKHLFWFFIDELIDQGKI